MTLCTIGEREALGGQTLPQKLLSNFNQLFQNSGIISDPYGPATNPVPAALELEDSSLHSWDIWLVPEWAVGTLSSKVWVQGFGWSSGSFRE